MFRRALRLATLSLLFSPQASDCQNIQVEVGAQGEVTHEPALTDRHIKTVTFEAGLAELGFSIDIWTGKRDTVDYVDRTGRAAELGVMTGWKIIEINGAQFQADNPPMTKLVELKKSGYYPVQVQITFDATEGELGSRDLEYFEECVTHFEGLEADSASSDFSGHFDDFNYFQGYRVRLLDRIKSYGADRIEKLSCDRLGEGCQDMPVCENTYQDESAQVQCNKLQEHMSTFRTIIDETLLEEANDDVYFGAHDVCKLIVACRKGTKRCKPGHVNYHR